MLKIVDRIFGWLLGLVASGHTVGTFLRTQPMGGIFIWSLGSSLAAGLLATLNVVRAGRPNDKTLALIIIIGTARWALVALGLGISIGNVLDLRPLGHVIISIILVIFSALTLLRSSSGRQTHLGNTAAAINLTWITVGSWISRSWKAYRQVWKEAYPEGHESSTQC